MSELHVYRTDVDFFVAYSIADAWELHEEFSGYSRADYERDYPDDPMRPLANENVPARVIVDNYGNPTDEGRVDTVTTWAEWVQRLGRGYLASTEI